MLVKGQDAILRDSDTKKELYCEIYGYQMQIILYDKLINTNELVKIADNLEKFSWEKCAKSYIKYFDIWSEGIL